MKLFSRVGSAVGMLTGILVLLGWATGWEICKQAMPGTVAMNLITAMCFILAGAALWILSGVERERRRAEAEGRRYSEQVQALYDKAPCGYHSLDAEARFLTINDTELGWLGYAREEVIGKRITDLLSPASRELFERQFAQLKERGGIKDAEYEFVRKDGSVLPALLNATATMDGPGGSFSTRASVFDISKRKRVEEERNRFFTLSLDLFCIAGFDGYFKVLNDSWERTLGFTREELLASPYLDFIHPEDRPVTSDQAARNSQGQSAISFANRYRCKDGSYRWFLWNATPVTEEGLIFAVARDITDKKRVDDSIKELNETLRMRTVELEVLNKELEAFSYSVSHDLRAPVRHISGFVELLSKQDLGTDPKTQRYLRFVADSARQMGQLVDDLLSFSRMSRTEMTVGRVALGPLVSDVQGELAGSCANRSIDWRVNGLPEVSGDAAMLRLVFVNLLSNAIKYTGKQPQAEIEIGWKPNGVEEVMYVRDNGVGFDMKYAGKLFGVFQRLHRSDEFEGTGIGLANVRRIIHRHGGRTWAEGEVGKGATIYFSVPRKEKAGAEAKDIKAS